MNCLPAPSPAATAAATAPAPAPHELDEHLELRREGERERGNQSNRRAEDREFLQDWFRPPGIGSCQGAHGDASGDFPAHEKVSGTAEAKPGWAWVTLGVPYRCLHSGQGVVG